MITFVAVKLKKKSNIITFVNVKLKKNMETFITVLLKNTNKHDNICHCKTEKNNKHDYHKLFYCKTGKKSTKIITFVTVKLKKQQT